LLRLIAKSKDTKNETQSITQWSSIQSTAAGIYIITLWVVDG
jgi:hypothetical protein